MSESESTQVVEEENRRLSGIQQLTEQEQQEEIKKREKNKAYQLHKEYDDYEQAKKDLELIENYKKKIENKKSRLLSYEQFINKQETLKTVHCN